jgi:hypothetical protein
MTFKVIITHPSTDGDEHTYYGTVFLNPGIVKTETLEFSSSNNDLRATFTFGGDPIKVGEKFLALLIPVNESETIEPPLHKFGENHPPHEPEVVKFS